MNHTPDQSRFAGLVATRRELRQLCVALIGVGALGSEVSRLLGSLQFCQVKLIDGDIVEADNYFHNAAIRGPFGVGRRKVDVFADYGRQTFPATEWIPLPVEIADVGFGDLEDCDLLFSCTDSALARTETAWVSQRLGIPMVDAGLKGSACRKGRVAWFPGTPDTACYLCQLSHSRRAELLSQSLAASFRCTGEDFASPLRATPATSAMASLVAAMQIELGLHFWRSGVTDAARAWEFSLEGQNPAMESFAIPRSSECPWHAPELRAGLHTLPEQQPLRDSLDAAPGEILADWPLCLHARCLHCGHAWQPMQRVARLRRHARCPQCRQANPLPVQVIATVRAADDWARHTPAQLGFPSNHRYTLRRAG